jgi:hypothetical protein
MQRGVRSNQDISQKKLKGRPRILGSMRSHKETVKHPPTKGMRPNRTELSDGFCKRTPFGEGPGMQPTQVHASRAMRFSRKPGKADVRESISQKMGDCLRIGIGRRAEETHAERERLAGAEGFEPSPSSLTVRCPTGWTTPQRVLQRQLRGGPKAASQACKGRNPKKE